MLTQVHPPRRAQAPSSPPRIRVGLLGHGRAGQAVAQALLADASIDLRWVARRHLPPDSLDHLPGTEVPVVATGGGALDGLIERHPVDALVDFSSADSAAQYLPAVRRNRLMLVSAISSYTPAQLAAIHSLADACRVMCSPNITVGINFLIVAARLLRTIAPHADIEIIEQHFRDKPEISGTALKLAQELGLGREQVTSLRLGGIVGHHEVIFGFPHQTVRLVHESIRREAFGSGAAFALQELSTCPPGFYTFENLMRRKIRAQLQQESAGAS